MKKELFLLIDKINDEINMITGYLSRLSNRIERIDDELTALSDKVYELDAADDRK